VIHSAPVYLPYRVVVLELREPQYVIVEH